MCKWGTDVEVPVIVPASNSYTGCDRPDIVKIDACIAPIVDALNRAGVRTDGSCCGHGQYPGWIVLHDGRLLTITENDRENCVPASSAEEGRTDG